MIEKEFRLLIEKGLLVIPDFPIDYLPSKADLNSRAILKVELAKNFGIVLLEDSGITEEYVMQFLNWLKQEGKLKTQPYFPNLLPVDKEGVNVEDLIDNPIEGHVIEQSKLKRKILKLRRPDSLELSWLEDKLKYGHTKVLVKFLSSFLTPKGKIKAGRKERRVFMCVLEHNTYSSIPTEMLDFWKKVALWIHPSDYPNFPNAQKFLFKALEIEKKKEPEKPRLKKLMWKGWKEGKDFDVFESYIDQDGLTPIDILKNIRDYERCPRVSRWKKTEGVELGKKSVGEEETEVVDLMLLQLKEKLLGMLKPLKANLRIPDSFYKIPAHTILKYPLVIAGGILPDEVKSFRITASKNVNLITYNLEGNNSYDRGWGHLEDCLDFFIVGYQMAGWNRTKLSITFADKKGETISRSEIRANEDVKSLILFGYESASRTLKWIGEPSKTFYAGKPSGITDWKSVWNVVMERKPILSLGEMAEKMYDNPEKPTEELTAERIRIDLGL